MKITHKGIIEDLEVFHNDKNNFISLTERKVGHKYSPIDVIYQLASLNALQLSLDSTKRTKLEKDEVRVITLLAQTLGISQAKLELFLQIPMLGQYDAILKSFDHFLDTTTYDKTALKKFVEYTTAQMDFQDKQLDFLQELPSKIRVETQPNLKIPVAFIKKLYMENEYQLTLNDVLELTSMAFKKEGANVDDDEESHIYNIIEFMALLKKGALPEADGAEAIRIKNKALMKLMKIMNSRSFPGRLTTITSCFKERNHPAKTFVALLAFLTGNTDNTEILHSDDPDEKDKESVTSYLCSVFKVFPEMIDLFNLAFEKNAMAFCKASIPIVKRICNKPVLDKNNLESILCLLNGEKFSSHFLAEKLSVKSHIVDFFICAGRLNYKRTWEEEIDSIKDRLSLKRAFKEIAVDISEFTALLKIAKKADTIETLPSLLRNLKVNEAVRTDYLQALMQLAKGILPNLSERKSRSSLEQMRTSVAGFLKNINLNQNYAFIISNLVGGTFMVLDFYSTKLGWIFPLEKPDEKTRLVNLAMGLCGAINFRVEIGPNLSNIQAGKSNQANPSNTKAATKVEKSHTFAYASQLLQETLGITSKLGRIFLFDPETYNTVFKNVKEILVVFVLNLARMPEFYHDLIVFYEFLKNLDEEYNKFDIKDEEKSKCLKKEIGFLEESVSAIFQYHFDFQWENLEEFAKNDLLCSEIIGEIVGKDNTEEVCGKIQQQFLDLMPNENQGPEESESFKGPFELYQKHFSNPNLSFAGFMFEFMRKLYRKIAIGGSETTGDSYINTKNCFGHYSMFRTFFLFRTPKLGANTNYTRVIWNLHHLMTCIERQTLLEPLKGWEVFPKFRMMKLVAASIGFSYSTIVEYSLSDSLFPQSYVRNMQKAPDNDQKKKFFQEYIEGEVISCIRELNSHRVSSKNNNSSKPMRFEYISGFKTETWKSFWICDYGLLRRLDPKKIKQLRHWDSFMSYFNYEKTIFGNPALGNFSIPTGIEHANEFFPYENTSLEEVTRFFKADMQVANLYCSLELISHIESNKNTKEELKDYRTGLPARDVMRCMVKFENSLNHSNMALILGILSDKMEVLFRKDNVIGQESPESAKIYAALLTVSTFSVSRKKDNQKVLRDVITSTLSKYLDSETVRLQELLYFTLTGKGQLKEISATFDIPAAVSEFLTNCITYKSKLRDVAAGKEQDEQEDETENTSQDNFDLEKALGDVLQINELELKTIYCLLQLYWGRRKQGWEPLLLSLLNNNTSVKNDRKNNIFIKLRKSLDLNVLQKNYAKKGERSFLAALKSTKPDESKEMELFEIMFNCISPPSKQLSQDKDLLKSVIQFIKIIVNGEKRELFNFAYTFDSCGNKDDEKEGKSDHFHEKNEANLCQIFRAFQLDDDRSLENDIKLLRFLIIVNIGDSVPLFVRNRDIIDHVLKRGFDQISNVNEANQALVYGVLNWKIERIMFALKKKGHYETYLTCHSIFILLHFNKFLKPEKIEERQIFNLAARLFLCSIRSSMFSNVIHEEGSHDLLEDLSIKKFIEKIEKPVEKRFEDIHWQLRGVQRAKAEKKIPEVSLVELISKSLEPLEAIYGEGIGDHTGALEPNQSIGKNLEEQLTNAITMILSGEIFKALLMNKTEQKNLDKNFPKLLKFILDSHKQLTENSSKGGSAGSHNQLQSENAKKTITSFLQVIQQDKSKNLEDLLDLFFIFQGSLNSEKLQEKIIDKIVSILTNILTEQNVQPEYQKIIFSLVQLITDYQYHRPDQKKSYDQNQPNEQKKPKLVKKSLKFKKKIEIFFKEFIQNLLPDLKGQMIQNDSLKNPQGLQILTAELIQNLINLFEILYQQYPKGIANKDLLKNIMPKVMSIISELQILPKQVTEFLLGVSQGNLKSCTGILVLVVPDQTKAQAIEKFILQVADTIDLQQITSGLKIDLSAASQKDQIDEELSKIRAGSSDPHLLFRIVDKIGNGNGLVDTVEFQRLTNRMGVDLSEHRVLEIFSKVRIREGIQQQNLSAGLTEPEFIKAFQFLQNKNVFTAMTLLGITPTQLALIFTVLIILLVLLLAFIYLGIIAFSIGGSFGAVINSLFPVAGGLGLGKQGGDIKAKLDLKNIETSVENALNIVQSDKL